MFPPLDLHGWLTQTHVERKGEDGKQQYLILSHIPNIALEVSSVCQPTKKNFK